MISEYVPGAARTERLRPSAVPSFKRILLVALALLGMFYMTGCLQSSKKVLGNIRGKVYDSNGHVLRGAAVEVYGSDHTVVTDELGRYLITGVEPGSHKIVATYEGRSVVKVFDIPRGSTLEGADLRFDVIDLLPPVITDVTVASITETTATIQWKTDELSDSIVDFATGPIGLGTYTFLASDTAMVTEHSVELVSLLPNRTYHFRVRSRDFAANEGVSSDYQFMTHSGDAPAVVSGFAIVPPTDMERLTLTWSPNTEADLAGYNIYRGDRKEGPFAKINADPVTSVATSVSYTDEGLLVAWKYHYYVKAIDVAGNEGPPSSTTSMLTTGSLSEDRTWYAAETPYIVTGDIRVRGGAVLTIEPGVEVKFTQADHCPDVNGATMTDLIVQGGLNAVGTPESKVVFTSAETFPKKGNWGGIKFLSTVEADNQLRYATIMFADTGVRSEGSTPAIENTEIGLCAIGLDLGLSTALNVKYNTIRDCTLGLITANSNIRNNLFIDNQVGIGTLGADQLEHNTIDCLVGVEVAFGTPTIKNNIIAYTGSGQAIYGINQTSETATPSISFNDVYNFSIPYNGLTVATGSGNIASDPLFIGGLPYDYHLQTTADGYASNSPCLTSGDGGVQMGRYGP